jgi:hypothetical protein
MIMSFERDQLADILVDWCGANLDSDHFIGASQTEIAREVIQCVLFTLARDRTARGLFNGLLVDEMESVPRD